jgi:hypothetical protein
VDKPGLTRNHLSLKKRYKVSELPSSLDRMVKDLDNYRANLEAKHPETFMKAGKLSSLELDAKQRVQHGFAFGPPK